VIQRAGGEAKVRAAYGDKPAAELAREITTDSMITEPDRYLARQMSSQGLPVFVYEFSYVPDAMRAGSFGASHGMEVPFVFSTLPTEPVSYGGRDYPAATADDQKLSAAMQAYWVAFARTGDPDSAGGPAWPRYTADNDAVLEFGDDGTQVREGFAKARLDLIEAAHRPAPALQNAPPRAP
jgi:para-nitrobenzyl esterase